MTNTQSLLVGAGLMVLWSLVVYGVMKHLTSEQSVIKDE